MAVDELVVDEPGSHLMIESWMLLTWLYRSLGWTVWAAHLALVPHSPFSQPILCSAVSESWHALSLSHLCWSPLSHPEGTDTLIFCKIHTVNYKSKTNTKTCTVWQYKTFWEALRTSCDQVQCAGDIRMIIIIIHNYVKSHTCTVYVGLTQARPNKYKLYGMSVFRIFICALFERDNTFYQALKSWLYRY